MQRPPSEISVLFVSNDPAIFDRGSAVRARMRSYAERLGSLTVLSVGSGESVEEGKLRLIPVSGSPIAARLRLAHTARTLVLAGSIDVVSAQDPFELGLIAWRAVRGTKTALHIQVHTDFRSSWFVRGVSGRMRILNTIRRLLAGRNLRRADAIRVVSHRIAESIQSAYEITAPIAVLPIAVDTRLPAPAPLPATISPDAFVMLAVSRLEPEKRVADAIDAFAQVAAEYPHAVLLIVGDGRERERLARQIQQQGLSSRITLLGARADARALMGSAHAFVQASAFEGYGLTLVEAALSRLPIVTTEVGVVGELLRPNEDVLTAPVVAPRKLAAALRATLADAEARQKRAHSAEARVATALATVGDLGEAIARDLAAAATTPRQVY